jgi:hypothetical protein
MHLVSGLNGSSKHAWYSAVIRLSPLFQMPTEEDGFYLPVAGNDEENLQ